MNGNVIVFSKINKRTFQAGVSQVEDAVTAPFDGYITEVAYRSPSLGGGSRVTRVATVELHGSVTTSTTGRVVHNEGNNLPAPNGPTGSSFSSGVATEAARNVSRGQLIDYWAGNDVLVTRGRVQHWVFFACRGHRHDDPADD
jgi:hypothetical protein